MTATQTDRLAEIRARLDRYGRITSREQATRLDPDIFNAGAALTSRPLIDEDIPWLLAEVERLRAALVEREARVIYAGRELPTLTAATLDMPKNRDWRPGVVDVGMLFDALDASRKAHYRDGARAELAAEGLLPQE